jgi:hypothetical protein
MKRLYRGAQAYVSIARRISSAFYFTIAALLIAFAVWLAFPFGEHWFLTGIAILVGLQGAAVAVKASEIFLTTKPPERELQQRQVSHPSRRTGSERR